MLYTYMPTWCAARLSAIKNKICSEYGKHVPEVRDQLLECTDVGGRTIETLKICEQVIPYVSDETVQSGSDRIPQKIVDQTKLFQKSHEHTIKAIELEQRFKTHLELVQKNKDDLNQLYGESMSMYQRSMVPPHERPMQKQVKHSPPLLNEQVAKEFLSVIGVTGCGYRFQILDVYISNKLTGEQRHIAEVQVQTIAEKHGIMEYKIRLEQKVITEFAEYEVGSTLTSRHDRSATLGGFALKGERKDLSLLVARHFADDGRPVYVCDENGKKCVFAHIMPTNTEDERYATLDIAAGLVLQRERTKCLTMFKDHLGTPLASNLSSFENEADIEWLKGLPVHIWGASSSPGLGKIIIPDFYVEGMKRLVKIEDRHPVDKEEIVPFSKEGDSGAIVCADDPDGEKVHVVSMVSGSSNYEEKQQNPDIKGEYLSIRLKDGLMQLEKVHGDTFNLC
ncbi:uncharacterized protein LOC132723571 [Ruditapes philippinarum]|uniref:uncharacterized protein LOC132723571 n=1 Tax=Ruditapes philippinarum TaxID=129788 RepID=UPI00295BB8A0|nr:uncharacterized protein LOC132723571 [Ruditapes philippinarum]